MMMMMMMIIIIKDYGQLNVSPTSVGIFVFISHSFFLSFISLANISNVQKGGFISSHRRCYSVFLAKVKAITTNRRFGSKYHAPITRVEFGAPPPPPSPSPSPPNSRCRRRRRHRRCNVLPLSCVRGRPACRQRSYKISFTFDHQQQCNWKTKHI